MTTPTLDEMDMDDMLEALRLAAAILRANADEPRLADAVEAAAARWEHEVMEMWDRAEAAASVQEGGS